MKKLSGLIILKAKCLPRLEIIPLLILNIFLLNKISDKKDILPAIDQLDLFTWKNKIIGKMFIFVLALGQTDLIHAVIITNSALF